MARKKKESEVISNETVTPGAHAVYAAGRISKADAALSDAKADLKIQWKVAADLGVNEKALKHVMKVIAKNDIESAVQFHRDCFLYLSAFGKPIEKSQMDLWNLTEARKPEDEAAFDAGRYAGITGGDNSSNPHESMTAPWQQWNLGFSDGERQHGYFKGIAEKSTDELIKAGGDAGLADDGFYDSESSPSEE